MNGSFVAPVHTDDDATVIAPITQRDDVDTHDASADEVRAQHPFGRFAGPSAARNRRAPGCRTYQLEHAFGSAGQWPVVRSCRPRRAVSVSSSAMPVPDGCGGGR